MDARAAEPFVGRDAEQGVLDGALELAAAGRGQLVLLAGEAGIGKTRLAEEVAVRASEHGVLVLRGRAGDTGAAPAFWPWLQPIRTYLTSLGDADPERELGVVVGSLGQLLPELRDVLRSGPAAPAVLDEEGVRARVFEAVSTTLHRVAERQPIMVILDDLHDMDPSSLLLLRHVTVRLAESRVLLVGTYRTEELGAGSVGRAVVREVLRAPHAREILLRGLESSDVEAYIRATTGEAAPSSLAGRLVDETDGNALFVTELVRHLEFEGRLSEAGDTGGRVVLPESVREVVQERLARLPDEGATAILRTASVIGREVDVALLEQLTDRASDEVLGGLDDAVKLGILVETDDPLRYRFHHALVREAVYEELRRPRRMELHRAVADAIERSAGGLADERASEIAHHLLAAGSLVEPERAARFAELAGVHALSRLAYEEAARLFASALAALDRAPDEARRVELLLRLGDALARSGDAAGAKSRFFHAAGLARRLGMPEHLGRAALGYGGRFVWEASRGDPHLVSLLDNAIAETTDRRDALRARLLARLAAGPLRDDPDRSRRDRLSAEAVEIAESLDDPATLAYVLDGRYAAIWGPHALEERMEIARRLIATARLVGDRERELQGHHYLCLASLEAGDLGAAEREATDQRILANALKQPAQLLYAMTVDTTLAVLQGNYDEAARLIPQATAVGERAEQAMTAIYSLFERYMIARDRGSAASLVDELITAAGRFPSYVVVQALIIDAYIHAGRETDARSALGRLAAGNFAEIPQNDEWLFAVTMLADNACELRETAAASRLEELLTPFADRVAVSAPDACTGSVARVLGRLAFLLGRTDEALAHFERAIAINTRLNARPWLARTKLNLAELLLVRGLDERAGSLLDECATEAESLGMASVLDEVTRLREPLVSSRPVRRAFLFSDIVRSTELVAAIGDEAWDELVDWHDRALRDLFARHGGREIDHAGDGFFVSFESGAGALACAVAIQRQLAAHRRSAGFAPQVRIGIHADDARERDGRYVGAGVHRAARIGAAASGGEILVSRDALDDATPASSLGEERTLELKGFAAPADVVSVRW